MQASIITKYGLEFNDTTGIFSSPIYVSNCLYDYPHLQRILAMNPFAYSKYIFTTEDMVYVKFIKSVEDGKSHTWTEIALTTLPKKPIGTDIDSFKSNVPKFIEQKGKDGRKFLYNITPAGKELLDVAKKNMVYYRIARWFMPKIGDTCEYVMNLQLKTGDSSLYYDDVSEDSALDLVKELLNLDGESNIHKIGSIYKILRSFFSLANRNDSFFDVINCKKVNDWLEDNKNSSIVQAFSKKLTKIQKKWSRKRLAA